MPLSRESRLMSNDEPQAENQNPDGIVPAASEPSQMPSGKYVKGVLPTMLGNTRVVNATRPGRATVLGVTPPKATEKPTP